MNMTTNLPESPQDLRQRAEELFRSSEASIPEATSPEEIQQILYELRVHQIQLEMQNEELRRIQEELDISQARYFELYDLAPVGYLTLNNKKIISEVNLAAATMFGFSRSLLVKEPISRILAKEDQLIFYKHLSQCIESGAPQDWDMRMIRIDGISFWAHLQASPAMNGEFWITLNDISEQKQAEETLRESESNYRTLADSGQLLIWSSDTDKLCYYFNKVWLEFTGQTLEHESGNGWAEGVHPEDFQRCLDVYIGAFDRREAFSMDYRLRRHDGEYRWIQDDGCPRYDSNGTFAGYIGYCLDITERKRAEELKEVFQQQFQQTQKLESLGILAGGIAHDFNNILTVIICNCSLLLQRPHMVEQLVPEIDTAAQRAADLCRQMLIYAGKAQPIPTKFNVKTLVEEMVKMLKATINQNVTITLDLSADIPSIKADASQIRQVIMNLIINASEAIGTEQGNITASLAIAVIEAEQNEKDYLGKVITPGSYICLNVTDSGCGMDEGTKRRIFEPFYTTKFTGRGLGMSAVLGIIMAHNGALQLTSQQGVGTTFKVYLPVQSTEPVGDLLPHVSVMPWQGSGTVLLVEDEPQLIMVAKALIQALGFSVIEAANGQIALELYQKHAEYITLVLTDIGMPVMDGYTLIHELKKLNPELPIIVSSGFGDAEVTSRIHETIAGCVSKPYSFDQLREVLKGVVEGCQKQV